MTTRICENCGKQFEGIANARYCCDECRRIGADRKRKDWEKRTDYDRKNRQKVNEYRARKAAQAIAEQTEQKPVPVPKPSQKSVKRHYPKRSGILGEMINAKNSGDIEAYLSAFRDYEISLVPSGESRTQVNGISVNDPCFVEYALAEIYETGRIIISKG